MISALHVGSEIRRFGHGRLPRLALTVIMLLPLIFGGLFLSAYWDPIGRIDKLPVALVNSDKGADVEGSHMNAGDEVVKNLAESKKVDFHIVSADEARQGVADGTYYFALEFPEDFSDAVVSASTDHPRTAQMQSIYNNANGLIGTTLGNQVTATAVIAIDEELGSQVTDKLLVGFNTIGTGMDQAGEGSKKLAEGVKSAREGSEKLADGNQQLADGAGQLDSGAKELGDGMTQLDNGIKKASDGAGQLSAGMNQLDGATDKLGAGAGQISAGVGQIVGLAQQASATQSQVIAPLVNLSAQLRASGLPPAIGYADQLDATIAQLNTQGVGPDSQMITQLNKLNDGAAELQRQLADPTADYRGGVIKARDASTQLATGLQQLSDGSGKLVVGTQTLNQGTSKLVGASSQLSVGAAQLRDGLVQLDEGSNTLSLKINEGAGKVPRFEGDKEGKAADALAAPVRAENTGQTLTKFGVGLAPFFISLGLFMGGTVLFMVLRPLQRRAIDSGMSPVRSALASWIPAVLVGWAQATFIWLVITQLLHIGAAHPVGLYFVMLLASLTFVSITHAINSLAGPSAGRVLCLAFMALQLVSSGGLYPPETQPKFIKWFHTYDPMTYSVNAFRQMIIGSDFSLDHRFIHALIVLACIAMGCWVLSSIAAWRDRVLTIKTLHPELNI